MRLVMAQGRNQAWGWRKIVKLRAETKPSNKHMVGKEDSIFQWIDNWHPKDVLYEKFSHRTMYDFFFFWISNEKMLLKEKGLQCSNTYKRVKKGIEGKTALQSNKEWNKKDLIWRIDRSHPSKLLAFCSLQRHHMMLAEQPSKKLCYDVFQRHPAMQQTYWQPSVA